MSRVIHFEVHAENFERAAAFYRAVFEWEITKWEGPADYMMIVIGPKEMPGINGGMVKRVGDAPAEMAPVNGFVCTMDVDSVDTCLEKIIAAGGTLALPKMEIPKMGWLAYCKDTEGNMFGIMQTDPNAA